MAKVRVTATGHKVVKKVKEQVKEEEKKQDKAGE